METIRPHYIFPKANTNQRDRMCPFCNYRVCSYHLIQCICICYRNQQIVIIGGTEATQFTRVNIACSCFLYLIIIRVMNYHQSYEYIYRDKYYLRPIIFRIFEYMSPLTLPWNTCRCCERNISRSGGVGISLLVIFS